MVKTIDLGGRLVGPSSPCFVIAEVGVNHNGDPARAKEMIDAAAEAGADAVKFQTFNAVKLSTNDAPKATYQKAIDAAESQVEMLKRLELSENDHRTLIEYTQKRGLIFMSTPFEEDSANFLDKLGVSLFKVPSGEVTNLPFLEHLARKGKPLIVSTGMCSLGEVEMAVDAIEAAGNRNIVLLHCVSNYPADPADVNLHAMNTLQAAFGYAVGYSDHTLGIAVGTASVAMGACVVEKHFTLDRDLPGPDHKASLEPPELADLVSSIRTVESALGCGRKVAVHSEKNTADVARKSLVAARDIPAGSKLTDDAIVAKRPGTGLPPSMRPFLLNRAARTDIASGTLLALGDVA